LIFSYPKAVVIDEDTVEACRNLWASQQGLPGLLSQLPQTGRLKTPQQMPYATITSELQQRRAASADGAFYDFRKVVVKIYGVKADCINAAGAALALFNRNLGQRGPTGPTLTFPSGSRFMRWWPAEGAGDMLKEDPAVHQGLDIWSVEIVGLVQSVRF
jgi:hypothetical protein